nr:glycosyltransferase family 2 protein [Xaviernesmea oryzae]
MIPVYNRASLVEKTIRSVLNQTFTDFEIVIVDDGSKDNVAEVIGNIPDERIRFISVPNQGASTARNIGVDNSNGLYIAFLDSDDFFLPEHLATMKAVLDAEPDVAVYSPVIVDRGRGRTFIKPPRALRPGENMARYLINDRGFVQTSGLVLPIERAKRVRYRRDAGFGDDTDFAIRLQLDGCEFRMLERPTVIWVDDVGHTRLSISGPMIESFPWLEDLKDKIPKQAYLGYRGWHLAKKVASRNFFRAQLMYWQAVFSGAFSPRLAMVVFLQIVLPDSLYRWLANRGIMLAKYTGAAAVLRHLRKQPHNS